MKKCKTKKVKVRKYFSGGGMMGAAGGSMMGGMGSMMGGASGGTGMSMGNIMNMGSMFQNLGGGMAGKSSTGTPTDSTKIAPSMSSLKGTDSAGLAKRQAAIDKNGNQTQQPEKPGFDFSGLLSGSTKGVGTMVDSNFVHKDDMGRGAKGAYVGANAAADVLSMSPEPISKGIGMALQVAIPAATAITQKIKREQIDKRADETYNPMYDNASGLNFGNAKFGKPVQAPMSNHSVKHIGGKSHEQGGTPVQTQGGMVEAEKGEAMTGDYIFSDSLGYDKRGMLTADMKKIKTTFADKAKAIEAKYKGKDKDRIAQASKKFELDNLKQENETVRVQVEPEPKMGTMDVPMAQNGRVTRPGFINAPNTIGDVSTNPNIFTPSPDVQLNYNPYTGGLPPAPPAPTTRPITGPVRPKPGEPGYVAPTMGLPSTYNPLPPAPPKQGLPGLGGPGYAPNQPVVPRAPLPGQPGYVQRLPGGNLPRATQTPPASVRTAATPGATPKAKPTVAKKTTGSFDEKLKLFQQDFLNSYPNWKTADGKTMKVDGYDGPITQAGMKYLDGINPSTKDLPVKSIIKDPELKTSIAPRFKTRNEEEKDMMNVYWNDDGTKKEIGTEKKPIDNTKQGKSFLGDMTTGDKLQLASSLPAVMYNMIQGLRKTEKEPTFFNREKSNVLSQIDNLKFDDTAYRNQMTRDSESMKQNISNNSTSVGVQMANLANMYGSQIAGNEKISTAMNDVENEKKMKKADALMNFGNQEAQARMISHDNKLKNKAAKQAFMATAMSQLSEGINKVGVGKNAEAMNKLGLGLLNEMAVNFKYGNFEEMMKKISEGSSPLNYTDPTKKADPDPVVTAKTPSKRIIKKAARLKKLLD